ALCIPSRLSLLTQRAGATFKGLENKLLRSHRRPISVKTGFQTEIEKRVKHIGATDAMVIAARAGIDLTMTKAELAMARSSHASSQATLDAVRKESDGTGIISERYINSKKEHLRTETKLRALEEQIRLAEVKFDLSTLMEFLTPRYLVYREEDRNIELSRAGHEIKGDDINNALRKIEVILLLGSNDPKPAEQAAELYKQIVKYNPNIKIVASGKGGHPTVPGEAPLISEAEQYAKILRSLDVPEDAIIIESESTNSGENIIFSRRKLQKQNISAKRVAIVQTPAAQLRSNLVFEKKWSDDWEYYISYPPLSDIEGTSQNDMAFKLAYALWEIAKTIDYSYNPKYDFQTQRKTPAEVVGIIIKHYNRYKDKKIDLSVENFFAHTEALRKFFGEEFKRISEQYFSHASAA
ncbi:YdcF family protein, partial [Candidatus Margulisiibacteriota bacterium]